jgi:hypothetical protein
LHRQRARAIADNGEGGFRAEFPRSVRTIYWTATEASDEFAYGFKLAGLKQGKTEKAGGMSANLFVFLAWPFHDGDVAAEIRARLSTAVLRSIALIFLRRS